MVQCVLCKAFEEATGSVDGAVPSLGGAPDYLMSMSSPPSPVGSEEADSSPTSVLLEGESMTDGGSHDDIGQQPQSVEPPNEEERRQNKQWRWGMKRMRPAWRMCDAMLLKLMNHEYGLALAEHDPQLNKDPLTLGMVKQNLDQRLYFSPLAFYAEVRMVLDDLKLHPSCQVHSVAGFLLDWSETLFLEIDLAIDEIVGAYDGNEESEEEDK